MTNGLLGRSTRWTVLGAVAIGLLAAGIGLLSVGPIWAATAASLGVLVLALLMRDPALLPVLALPTTVVQFRIGDALSVSDIVLAGATAVAVFMLRRRGAGALRPLLWAGITYLAAAVPTLVLNQYAANSVEWAHEFVLVLGSLAVGFVVGRGGRVRTAFLLFTLSCIVISGAAIVVAVAGYLQSGEFAPAYALGLQKNAAGNALATSAVIAFARPPWLGWSTVWSWAVIVVCVLGIAATQSRQALVGLIVGALVISLRPRPQNGRVPKTAWLAAIPATFVVGIAVTQQFDSSNRFNSAFQRVDWYQQSIEIWQTSPVFGVGMRWWYTTRFQPAYDLFQPPNSELEVLTETGVFGLAGFLLMFAAAAWYLWHMDPVYGTTALAVVVCRFVQGQFDIYWVAGQASWLWIVAGACVGLQQLHRAGEMTSAQSVQHSGACSIAGQLPTKSAGVEVRA